MKAHQRIIREKIALREAEQNLLGAYWENIDLSFGNSEIREIDYNTAKSVILQYEWLGNMGTTEYAFGLYFDVPSGGWLGGVVCFGRTGGTNVYSSVCGEKWASKAITLCRGACVHWAHEHSASRLIAGACRKMHEKGYNIFIAYADPEAGETGTVYQACNWLYCGTTSPTEKFITPNGEIKDSRLVHAYTRDRRNGKLRYKHSRAEQKTMMIEQGYKFFMGKPKGRYVYFLGSKSQRKELKRALRWSTLPYPKG